MKIDFRTCVFMRDKTHTYLWLRDKGMYGVFLTMDNNEIEVVKVPVQENGTYLVTTSDEKGKRLEWPLVPFDYDFMLAARVYHNSTLNRSPKADEEIRKLLGLEYSVVPESEEPQPKKQRQERAAKAPRATGGVSLAELCKEMKIEPSAARKALRGKVEKPGSQWEWPTRDEASKVLEILKGLK